MAEHTDGTWEVDEKQAKSFFLEKKNTERKGVDGWAEISQVLNAKNWE